MRMQVFNNRQIWQCREVGALRSHTGGQLDGAHVQTLDATQYLHASYHSEHAFVLVSCNNGCCSAT